MFLVRLNGVYIVLFTDRGLNVSEFFIKDGEKKFI